MKKRYIVLLLATLLGVGGLSACTDPDSGTVTDSFAEEEFLEEHDWNEVQIVDIRTPEEYQEAHLDGAVNIDFYEPTFAQELDQLNKDEEILVYCRSGNRTGQTVELLKELGFTKIIDAGPIENAANLTDIEVIQ